MKSITFCLVIAGLTSSWVLQDASAASSARPHWPQFRGPNSQGVVDAEKPPTVFGPDKALLWKAPLPSGVSSPCIWGNRIVVTAFDGDRKKLETICLDRKLGKVIWRKEAPQQEIEKVHEVSSPANTSPATDGKRVFVHFPKYGVVAYEVDGDVAWTKPLPALNVYFGAGASPAVLNGTLILRMPVEEGPHILALRCADGETVWKTFDSTFSWGWATPVTWRESGRTVIGIRSMGQLTVLETATGTNLWRVSGLPMSSCATPAIGDGMIYLTGTGVFGNRENVVQPPDFEELISKHDANKDGRIGTDELPSNLLFINRGTSTGAGSHNLSEIIRQGPEGKHKSFDKTEWTKSIDDLLKDFNTGDFMKTAAFAVRTSGRGDATNNIAWTEPKGVPEIPSPLLYRGRLYYIKGPCKNKFGFCWRNPNIMARHE